MSVSTTELGFSYEYSVDVNTGTPSAPIWTTVRFISAVDPQITPVTQDAATYDDDGAPNMSKTSESWTLGFSVQMHRLPTGLYLPEVEALLALTQPDAVGNKAVGHFRWYDDPSGLGVVPNPNDAYEGIGTVAMTRGNTGNDGIAAWSVTITGQGRRTKIANPAAGVVPTGVTAGEPGSFTPAGAQTPASLAALKANIILGDAGSSKPSAAWGTGEYVVLGDASQAHWNGTAWAAGAAS